MNTLPKSHRQLALFKFLGSSNFLILLSFLCALPYASGFGLRASILFGFCITLSIVCGALTYIFLSKKTEFIGIGIAFGTALPGIINICLRSVGVTIWSTAFIFPLVVIFLAIFLSKRRQINTVVVSDISAWDMHLILSASLFAVHAWSRVLLPFALIIATAVITTYLVNRTKINYLSNAKYLSKISCWISILIYPISAQINSAASTIWRDTPIWHDSIGADTVFDEAQSYGVSKFGLSENIFRNGSPTKGHVLPHAWAGDLSSLVDPPRFLISGSTGLTLGMIGVASLIFVFGINQFKSKLVGSVAIVLVFSNLRFPKNFLSFLRRKCQTLSVSSCYLPSGIYI